MEAAGRVGLGRRFGRGKGRRIGLRCGSLHRLGSRSRLGGSDVLGAASFLLQALRAESLRSQSSEEHAGAVSAGKNDSTKTCDVPSLPSRPCDDCPQ
jgi:hypothetical protein